MPFHRHSRRGDKGDEGIMNGYCDICQNKVIYKYSKYEFCDEHYEIEKRLLCMQSNLAKWLIEPCKEKRDGWRK